MNVWRHADCTYDNFIEEGDYMARKTLLEMETDLDVINTDNEEGTVPTFRFNDDLEYGISADELNYILVKRNKANKKVTEPNEHIETYYMWKPIAYLGTFEKALKCYVEYKEKEMASNGDYCLADINNIRKEIYDIIDISTKNKDKINKLIESI